MKKLLFIIGIGAIASVMPVAAEYKPLLEKGKSWTCYYRGSNNLSSNTYQRGIGMLGFTQIFTASVTGDTIIGGQHCWRVVRNHHSYASKEPLTDEYYLSEDNETVSLCKLSWEGSPSTPGGTVCSVKLIPMMRFDVNVGDSLMIPYNAVEPNGEQWYFTEYITDCDTVVGSDGIERREISIGKSSWVEGIGFSAGYMFMDIPMSGCECYLDVDVNTLDCSVNGESIFKKKDFKYQVPYDDNIFDESLLTPGKSWTMARGKDIFTVSVERDTAIAGIPAKVLVDSYGKNYVVISDRGTVYGFFDYYGEIDPIDNAVPLVRCGYLSENDEIRRYRFGQEPDYDYESSKFTNRYECNVRQVNILTVNGVERKEWVLENENGEVVASWVEGIGAPDAQSWLMEMPADYDLRMIDCRQDGEVIFSAADFTHQSGIREVSADAAKRTGTYDLQGRRVDHPTRGLFIINGKKTLLK